MLAPPWLPGTSVDKWLISFKLFDLRRFVRTDTPSGSSPPCTSAREHRSVMSFCADVTSLKARRSVLTSPHARTPPFRVALALRFSPNEANGKESRLLSFCNGADASFDWVAGAWHPRTPAELQSRVVKLVRLFALRVVENDIDVGVCSVKRSASSQARASARENRSVTVRSVRLTALRIVVVVASIAI